MISRLPLMSTILPQGLINTTSTERIPVDDHDASDALTNDQLLYRFWKVHAVQSDLTPDVSTVRSRNLFWRVWSSSKVAQVITTDRLNLLWRRCSQAIDISSFDIDPTVFSRNARSIQLEVDSDESSDEDSGQDAQDGPSPTDLQPTSEHRGYSQSHITLNSYQTPESDQLQPVGRRLSQQETSLEKRNVPASASSRSRGNGSRSNTLTRQLSGGPSGSNSNAPGDSSSRRGWRLNSGSNKTYAAGTKTRTRPQPGRRRSSQGKTIQISQPKSPRLVTRSLSSQSSRTGAETDTVEQTRPGDGSTTLAAISAQTSGSTFALPSASSWQSVDDGSGSRPSTATSIIPTASPLLVDRDFRGKFVENQKKILSSSNLAGMARMKKTGSVVRFADEIAEEMGKGKERERTPAGPDNDQGPQGRSSISSEVITDDEDTSDVELPRTKSQLSLLIKDLRNSNESHDRRPGVLVQSKERQPSKEESKLLSMAHREGVTKAGGVSIPSLQRMPSSEEEHHNHSPSPPRLF